jgi:hypothetical protein
MNPPNEVDFVFEGESAAAAEEERKRRLHIDIEWIEYSESNAKYV